MVNVNGPSADRAAHRPMVSIRRTQVKERRSDRRQFRRTRTAGAICVRIVRNGPGIGFQGVGADGRSVAIGGTVRIVDYRPQGPSREAVGPIGFRRGSGRCGRCGRLRPRLFWRGRQADGPGWAFAPECYLDADLAQEGAAGREGARRVRPTLALSLRSPDLLGKAAASGVPTARAGDWPHGGGNAALGFAARSIAAVGIGAGAMVAAGFLSFFGLVGSRLNITDERAQKDPRRNPEIPIPRTSGPPGLQKRRGTLELSRTGSWPSCRTCFGRSKAVYF